MAPRLWGSVAAACVSCWVEMEVFQVRRRGRIPGLLPWVPQCEDLLCVLTTRYLGICAIVRMDWV